ncbi:hypothetical protein SAMN04488131_101428 [Flavobacterium xueshanense]|uniref:Uncharacterized protein n=1 Tax=Flavobacterium xueshanense TaxID=935223 RepID=A0A1I1ZRD9_9FLAO|nr:hypothetical protein SAMN04488131_101428 [Flavobacterium xueshanense]
MGNLNNTISKITSTAEGVSYQSAGSFGGLRCMTIDKYENIYIITSNQNSNYNSFISVFKISF